MGTRVNYVENVEDAIYEEPAELPKTANGSDRNDPDLSWKEYNLLSLGLSSVLVPAHVQTTDHVHWQMVVVSVVIGAFWLFKSSWNT